jgi:hypothetical protein
MEANTFGKKWKQICCHQLTMVGHHAWKKYVFKLPMLDFPLL